MLYFVCQIRYNKTLFLFGRIVMDIAESRLSAMESIGENLLRADNILKNEDRGIIS